MIDELKDYLGVVGIVVLMALTVGTFFGIVGMVVRWFLEW